MIRFSSLRALSWLIVSNPVARRFRDFVLFCRAQHQVHPGTSLTIYLFVVYADWCGPCKQIAPIYETLSASLSRPSIVTFVKINSDDQKDIASEYSVSALPTFLVFREGKVIDKVQGADPRKLQDIVKKLANEVESLGEASGSASGGVWKGAEIPRGYGDITDQIELRGLELLNADEDAGPVKTLFQNTKPSALDEGDSKDYVQSGADDQLLLFIPFQSTVKLHTLQVSHYKHNRSLTNPDVDHLPSTQRRRRCHATRPHPHLHQPSSEPRF